MSTRRGLSLTEVTVVAACVAVAAAIVVPAVKRVRADINLQTSMSNLSILGTAHLLYAADWSGRQPTWVRDDLGEFSSVDEYNDFHGCIGPDDPPCQPPLVAGFGVTGDGETITLWSYSTDTSVQSFANPIIFPGQHQSPTAHGWGAHRPTGLLPIHDYVNGRYHDPVFYAPKDTLLMTDVAPCLDTPSEFNGFPASCNPAWSSYARSAAALLNPEVMRANADGGYQDVWSLPDGFTMPGLFQAMYPDLKTLAIEHSWLQGPPAACNPAFFGCTPYYFNQGLLSQPATLFYDGHVRLLPNTEALAADQQVLVQTGGVDGLWHRGTPFGDDGYFIGLGWDGSELSHHVLTTDGILGRDTVADMGMVAAPRRVPRLSPLATPKQRLPAPASPGFIPAE